MNNGRFSIIVVIGLVLVGVGLSAFTVNEREKAIKLRLGEVVKADFEPGLHWKMPWQLRPSLPPPLTALSMNQTVGPETVRLTLTGAEHSGPGAPMPSSQTT